MLLYGAMKNKNNTNHAENYLANLETQNRQTRIAELHVFKLTAQRLYQTAQTENDNTLLQTAQNTLAMCEYELNRITK
jgi:hypothetical protein